jgi:hypothetical protein
MDRIFAGEARRIVRCLDRERPCGYHFGVSLMAVLRRERGDGEGSRELSGGSTPQPTGELP